MGYLYEVGEEVILTTLEGQYYVYEDPRLSVNSPVTPVPSRWTINRRRTNAKWTVAANQYVLMGHQYTLTDDEGEDFGWWVDEASLTTTVTEEDVQEAIRSIQTAVSNGSLPPQRGYFGVPLSEADYAIMQSIVAKCGVEALDVIERIVEASRK